jgi:hypothetical protein
LKETVLSGDYALGEEEIVLVLRVNVSDSPAIAQDVDALFKSVGAQLAGDNGESFMGGSYEISFLGGLGENCKRK